MKNKIIGNALILVLVIGFSSNVFANEDNSFFQSNTSATSDPGGHDASGDPAPAAPIDSYTFGLFVSAAMIAIFYRNKLIKKIK